MLTISLKNVEGVWLMSFLLLSVLTLKEYRAHEKCVSSSYAWRPLVMTLVPLVLSRTMVRDSYPSHLPVNHTSCDTLGGAKRNCNNFVESLLHY